jgi:hypothetical protein
MALTGFYSDHRGRGFRSAEVRALAREPIDRSEVRQVLDRTDHSVTVETTGGRLISLGVESAINLGIVR